MGVAQSLELEIDESEVEELINLKQDELTNEELFELEISSEKKSLLTILKRKCLLLRGHRRALICWKSNDKISECGPSS